MNESKRTDSRWRFWIDRGGTFTDVIGRAPDGRLAAAKLLSNDPARGEDAVIAGIRRLLGVTPDAKLPLERIAEVRVGTTVATNALLERKGAPTLFVTNAGLGDVLTIGDQARPEIFALDIRRPPPLYTCVATTTLRLDVDGKELAPLDETALRRAFAEAREAGCTSCAVALMHAWRHGEQEQCIAEFAQAAGFEQVVTSHEVSPLMRLVPRAATTVAEAYLAPVVARYTERLADALPGVPLAFMKSDGGLAGGGAFAARDALLSGPAGGVVGAVETARRAGFERVIGFDMGGTSTDVCHYAGGWERKREVEIAGVRLALPMLAVEAVAAGGGSIVAFDGGRLTVGPASAGADPGPACYRRGGPLTVTDCNLLLGRIAADHFPHLFGPNGDEALDEAAVRDGFAELAERVVQSPEVVAAGALAVAVEHMAAAIKRISIARGHDPADCVLNCFGGAGGQHACAVADALGIDTILSHPLAGVLSALGIGLSERSVLLERGLEAELPGAYETARAASHELEHDARRRLAADAPDAADAVTDVTALVRYAGNDTVLPVAFGTPEEIAANFGEAHRAHFGFTLDGVVVIAALRVEARARFEPPQWQETAGGESPAPVERRRVYFDDAWVETPFYRRADLPRGAALTGPAVLIEATATTVIEPGWRAEVAAEGEVLLHRESLEKDQSDPSFRQKSESGTKDSRDPVTLELMGARFMAIAEEMGEALRASAQSVNVRERLDFSCAVFAPDGALVANAPHIPVHLGAMSATIRALLDEQPVKRGEVWVTNDVYAGGTHLPDITVITPVYAEGDKPAFFVASRAHHADIGGVSPGSMPAASRHIEEEGVLIPFTRLVADGKFCEADIRALLEGACYPARNVERNLADLRAQIAANARGAKELLRLAKAHGLGNVHAYMRHLADYAEEAVRRALKKLSANGRFEAPLDDGSHIVVAIDVNRDKGEAVFDFAGTSGVREGNFNAPRAVVRAAVLYVLRTLIAEPIPLNDGCLAPIEIRVPRGSMLNPPWPHAVVAGNVEVSQVLTDALLAALGKLAASQGTMNNLTFGNARHQHYETIAGGAGAGEGFNGTSAVHTHMTNSRLTDPEVLEFRFPVTLEEFSVRKGTGGAGKWCGGDGAVRRIRFNEVMTVTILANRRHTDPFGLKGGDAGTRGETRVLHTDGSTETLDYAQTVELAAGDAIEIRTPGAGGFGSPL
ncbi:MAG: hydantoinase B/oxoprolinase family protein [Gammaproteobacteria bacterium]